MLSLIDINLMNAQSPVMAFSISSLQLHNYLSGSAVTHNIKAYIERQVLKRRTVLLMVLCYHIIVTILANY